MNSPTNEDLVDFILGPLNPPSSSLASFPTLPPSSSPSFPPSSSQPPPLATGSGGYGGPMGGNGRGSSVRDPPMSVLRSAPPAVRPAARPAARPTRNPVAIPIASSSPLAFQDESSPESSTNGLLGAPVDVGAGYSMYAAGYAAGAASPARSPMGSPAGRSPLGRSPLGRSLSPGRATSEADWNWMASEQNDLDYQAALCYNIGVGRLVRFERGFRTSVSKSPRVPRGWGEEGLGTAAVSLTHQHTNPRLRF